MKYTHLYWEDEWLISPQLLSQFPITFLLYSNLTYDIRYYPLVLLEQRLGNTKRQLFRQAGRLWNLKLAVSPKSVFRRSYFQCPVAIFRFLSVIIYSWLIERDRHRPRATCFFGYRSPHTPSSSSSLKGVISVPPTPLNLFSTEASPAWVVLTVAGHSYQWRSTQTEMQASLHIKMGPGGTTIISTEYSNKQMRIIKENTNILLKNYLFNFWFLTKQ